MFERFNIPIVLRRVFLAVPGNHKFRVFYHARLKPDERVRDFESRFRAEPLAASLFVISDVAVVLHIIKNESSGGAPKKRAQILRVIYLRLSAAGKQERQ